MRIKVTRDSVIDKFNPLERSPKHKKLPKILRSKTPEKARRADVISPRERKSSFVSPKQNVTKKKSKVRAINLLRLFDDSKEKKPKTGYPEPITFPGPPPSPGTSTKEDGCVPSLVSMKTEIIDDKISTPPPVKIKRSWKKHLPFSPGYKLFTPDSPAKAAASPHQLAIKLCFLGRLADPAKFEDEELEAKADIKSKRLSLQLIR